MLNRSILLLDKTLTDTSTSGQGVPRSNGNEGIASYSSGLEP